VNNFFKVTIGESNTGDAAGNHGKLDIIIGKFSSTGNLEWSHMYGGPDDEYATGIFQTSDDGYIFVGNTSSNSGQVQGNHGSSDVWIVRISKNGGIVWQKCVGTEGYDGPAKMEKSSSDGLLYIWQAENHTGLTISNTDSSGNLLSEASLATSISIGGMALTSDSGHIIVGQGPDKSGIAIKIDKASNIQWQKILNGSKTDIFNDVKQTADGGYIICGHSESVDGDLTGLGSHASPTALFPKSDAWIVKLSVEGQLQWQKLFGGSQSEITSTIYSPADGEYVFFGTTNSNDGDVSGIHLSPSAYDITVDWWLVKLSASNAIQGQVFLDVNRNGVKDPGEGFANNVRITSVKGTDQRAAVPGNGIFTNYIDTGSYTTSITLDNPYYTAQPSTRQTTFSTYNNVDTLNIAIQPLAGKRDVSINLLPVTPVRPGFNTQYQLVYKNHGTDTIANGTVELIKSNKLALVVASPSYTSMNGDTIRWNFTGLKPEDKSNITLRFSVLSPPLVNIGELLASTATITTGATDLTPSDNTSKLTQTVVGSYDPNDKTETHSGVLTQQQISKGEPLVYTIRFQNTGTDTAFNVIVRDTLSNKVDWNTLQMISSSDSYQLTIKDGNKLTWAFNKINLVDSNRNESASHGYVSFSVKPVNSLLPGDTIKNTSAIFFDYNLPVQTNTASTFIQAIVLPIKLTSFTAEKKGAKNKLAWIASSEIETTNFEVEKSSNARDFSSIGTLKANFSGLYTFYDSAPIKDINYYRLKMFDKDGSYSYSYITSVNNAAPYIASVYPNPTHEIITLKIDADKKTDAQIEIITIDGKVIQVMKQAVATGTTIKKLNVSVLRKGSYFIRVKTNEQLAVIKFEKN
jgi:uncharacterized repeat protein (TIGR01451 family)